MRVIVHNPGTPPDCAGIVPPAIEITWVPGTAVTTPLPQVVVAFGTGATTTPFTVSPGKLSSRDTLIRGLLFVFVSEIVNKEIPFGATVSGVNNLLTARLLIDCTVRSAVIGPGRV